MKRTDNIKNQSAARLGRTLLLALVMIVTLGCGSLRAQMKPGQVDIFMGVDLQYRDIFLNDRVFDVLLSLTPGVRWNMGHHVEAQMQVVVPLVNQFGDAYTKRVRVNMLSVSKQMAVGSRWRLKGSVGLFNYFRYGLDVRAMFIATKWLAFSGQVGYTGFMSMMRGWECSAPDRINFLLGPEFWLDRWNVQMWVRGGRFTFGDYGVIAEAYRHFKHVSVGVYGQYSDRYKEGAGFKIIVDLPPYRRCRHRINVRPASSFRLTNNVKANVLGNKEYITDPEGTERSGWFDPDITPWGLDAKQLSFTYKERDEQLRDKADKKRREAMREGNVERIVTVSGSLNVAPVRKEVEQ